MADTLVSDGFVNAFLRLADDEGEMAVQDLHQLLDDGLHVRQVIFSTAADLGPAGLLQAKDPERELVHSLVVLRAPVGRGGDG